jgi:hypothetical protein
VVQDFVRQFVCQHRDMFGGVEVGK